MAKEKNRCQGNAITEWFEVINYSASPGTNETNAAISTCSTNTSFRPLRLENHSNAHTPNAFKCSVERKPNSVQKEVI